MAFARHETFYLRDGWLRKGLRLVEKENFSFLRGESAPEVLGMGKNMVHSLRFWLVACGLITFDPDHPKEQCISSFGKNILESDPYFENEGTLWLLHYHLATDAEHSTTWYWVFNKFSHKEFDEETFIDALNIYAKSNGSKIAESSLKKDYQCFINTYAYEKNFNKSFDPEDNINCPLRELQLLRQTAPKTYRLNRVNRKSLSPSIVFYAIKKWQEDNAMPLTINISNIIDGTNNAGKVFNLSYEDIIYYLEELQRKECLSVRRYAGLDSVILRDISSDEILSDYFMQVRGENDEYAAN